MPAPHPAVDPPIPFPAIWAAGILGTPLAGLALYGAWRTRFPKAAIHARRASVVALIVWALVLQALGVLHGCAGNEPTPPPPAVAPRSSRATVTFTQIMLLYQRDKSAPTVTRTKEESLVLARTLIDRIQKGASMESLVVEFTDDRGNDGKPFNSGSYSMARSKPANEDIKRVAFGLDVGKLAPEPVDSGFAWHVIRRDD